MKYLKFLLTGDEPKQIEKFTCNEAAIVKGYYNAEYYKTLCNLTNGDHVDEINAANLMLYQ